MAKNKKALNPGIGITKKSGESTGNLLRRFVQKVKRSGVLFEARERSFRRRKPSKRTRRKSALVRVERREKYKKLKKWGKVR